MRTVRVSLLVSLLVLCSATLSAAPVTTIHQSGDPSNRVDIAVLGDGYTEAELAKYATDVQTFLNGFFAAPPYNAYVNHFNVHRVGVVSAESGADHPEDGTFVGTALDATYNCQSIEHLICVNGSKVNAVLLTSLAPAQRDVVLVLVNDPEYGGSGGALAVASTHTEADAL
jgi:hypothetical protein